jgi:hypothetical protein
MQSNLSGSSTVPGAITSDAAFAASEKMGEAFRAYQAME